MLKPTIGLEIHVELKTKTKMFCSCLNETWKIGVEEIPANTNICPICMGHPGTLPVANKEAIKSVIKAGLALNCEIASKSKFDRKNYFYPDLPKGYQISQYDQPLCKNGNIEIGEKKIGITRIHLEEDTGKLTHVTGGSLVDYNRAGVPLMELVTEPDIKSGAEAKEFCQELQSIFRELEISDADMEKGQMRCEVNISLAEQHANSDVNKFEDHANSRGKLGTKVEIKNLNSFRAVERSIDFEIKRQSEMLERGEKIIQETRGWDEKNQETFSQRTKEGSADYRYFPEPDIPPLSFASRQEIRNKIQDTKKDDIDIEKLKRELPELPKDKRQRFKEQYGFNSADAKVLTTSPLLADYTEQVVSELKVWLVDLGEFEGSAEEIWNQNKNKVIKLVAGWLINKLSGLLTARKLTYQDNKITAENFAEFVTMILTHKVSTKNANVLLERMLETGGDPSNILESEDLAAGGAEDLEKIITEVINKNPNQVEEFKSGKENIIKYFIGQVMKESKGKADPKQAEELLIQKLS